MPSDQLVAILTALAVGVTALGTLFTAVGALVGGVIVAVSSARKSQVEVLRQDLVRMQEREVRRDALIDELRSKLGRATDLIGRLRAALHANGIEIGPELSVDLDSGG